MTRLWPQHLLKMPWWELKLTVTSSSMKWRMRTGKGTGIWILYHSTLYYRYRYNFLVIKNCFEYVRTFTTKDRNNTGTTGIYYFSRVVNTMEFVPVIIYKFYVLLCCLLDINFKLFFLFLFVVLYLYLDQEASNRCSRGRWEVRRMQPWPRWEYFIFSGQCHCFGAIVTICWICCIWIHIN